MAAVRALLAGETVTTEGRYVRLRGVALGHPPAAPPPVSVGVRGPKSLELAGRVADGTVLDWLSSPAYVRWARERIDAGRAAAGRTDPHRVTVYDCCATDAAGEAAIRREWEERRAQPSGQAAFMDAPLTELALTGDAERVGAAARGAGGRGRRPRRARQRRPARRARRRGGRGPPPGRRVMNPGAGHGPQDMTTSLFTQAATVYVAVTDQERALAFYAGTLGFETRSDFPYADGERWIEVVPPGAATSLTLLPAGDARPAGVETGVALNVRDTAAAHAELRARGVDVDAAVQREGDPVVRWAGAALAGIPPMFRFRDPDGNSFLVGEGGP